MAAIVAGAHRPGLGMAFAVVFGWLLWRFLPAVGDVLVDAAENQAVFERGEQS